jgi:mono/diheme cytochrome c family protein
MPVRVSGRRAFCILVAAGSMAAAQPAAAQDKQDDEALIAAGAEVYQDKCSECHGERLVNPGSSFDLRKLRADERPRFDASVTNGKGQMPAWGGLLGADQFDALWAYIRSKAED